MIVSNSANRLSLRTELTNNDLELVQYAQRLLRGLEIDSLIGQYNRPICAIRLIRGKPVSFSSPTYWLVIRKRRALSGFRDIVGLSIVRKRRKLDVTLQLMGRFGVQGAASEWLRIYTKKGPRWVERREGFEAPGWARGAAGNTSPSH